MKLKRFLILIFGINLFFIFLKLYHHNQKVGLLYKKQHLERKRKKLEQSFNQTRIQLFMLNNLQIIDEKATQTLCLRPIKLKQIQHLDGNLDLQTTFTT
jgi:hypothetical protein